MEEGSTGDSTRVSEGSFFFFQAEDGIRDYKVTGVQTCALPIYGGGYCSYGPVTILYSGALLGALYDIPNVKYDGYRVLTNKPACGAMRGHEIGRAHV